MNEPRIFQRRNMLNFAAVAAAAAAVLKHNKMREKIQQHLYSIVIFMYAIHIVFIVPVLVCGFWLLLNKYAGRDADEVII
jgi:hypothetical protein